MYSCINQCCDIFYSHRIYLSVILFFNQFIHSPYQLFSHFFILIKTVLRISPTIDSSGWFSFYSAHRGSNSVTDISTVRPIPSLLYYFRSTERRSWCHVYPRNIKFKTFSHKAIRILSIQLFSYFLKKKSIFGSKSSLSRTLDNDLWIQLGPSFPITMKWLLLENDSRYKLPSFVKPKMEHWFTHDFSINKITFLCI